MEQDIATAATLLAGFSSAITAIWGYYFAVCAGVIAGIAAVSSSGKPLGIRLKVAMITIIVMFAIVNFSSLSQTTDQFNNVVDFISKNSSNLGPVVKSFHLSKFSLVFQPIGLLALSIWLATI